jgi:hypothetical protein
VWIVDLVVEEAEAGSGIYPIGGARVSTVGALPVGIVSWSPLPMRWRVWLKHTGKLYCRHLCHVLIE